MDIQDAIRHVLNGQAILFTGAGFSHGAKNIEDDWIPSGKTFAADLLTQIGRSKTDVPLEKASGAYLRRNTKRDLVELLTKRFTVKSVTKAHETLASLPWRRIYTTNYDMVFEEASQKTGKVCNSVDGIDSPQDYLSKSNLLVHINGAITRLTEARLDNSFKLISQSYVTDSFEKSGWAFHFRQDIRTASVVFFVGYSMYDLDVRRILFNEDISSKSIFVIAPLTSDNELDAEDLSDIGSVASIGIDAFAKTVKEIQTNYTPEEPELLLDAWEEVHLVRSAASLPSDGDVLDFLIKGDLKESLLLEAIGPKKDKYVLERTSYSHLKADLLKKGVCTLVVGGLGTGKTFALECASQESLSHGWRVFKLGGSSYDEISEAESICALSGEKLLIVENYQRHMELLRWLSDVKPQDISLVISARTSIHDLFANELYGMFGDNLAVHDLSKLSTQEIDNTVNLFNRYGLWGEKMSLSPEQKKYFVAHDCSKDLPSILVEILKSKHITERYKTLLSESSGREDVEKLLICLFSLEVLAFDADIYVIEELLANSVSWNRVRSQEELKAIVDFDANIVRTKSSVLANYLLHHVFPAKKVVQTMIGIVHEADLRYRDREFHEILNTFLRYGRVSSLLPEKNRLESTINFYEGVKNLQYTRRNPLFWLQYAIACLAFGKLDRAERYFDDAYSLAGRDYNTFQIDNHYARLLLEKAQIVPSINDAYLLIDQAKKIIFQQIIQDTRYYPYRVALGIFKCFERFRGEWTIEQNAYFKKVFQEIKRRCEMTSGTLRNHRYVVDCLAISNEMLGDL